MGAFNECRGGLRLLGAAVPPARTAGGSQEKNVALSEANARQREGLATLSERATVSELRDIPPSTSAVPRLRFRARQAIEPPRRPGAGGFSDEPLLAHTVCLADEGVKLRLRNSQGS